MPYVITVLALVVISVGFTLFQSQDKVAMEATEPTSIQSIKETVDSLIATATPPLITDNETPTPSPQPENILAEAPQSQTTEVPPNPAPKPSPSPTPKPAPASAPAITTDYRNGSYSTQSSFRTPDGTYQISVNLTIANDKITNSSVSFDAKGARDGYSKRFSSAYQSSIIGQDLGTASLSRVGGASLTTRAFNNALSGIRSQATS